MGLAASVVQIDRAAQLKEEWLKVVPVIERLSQGDGWMEFSFHLLGRYRVITHYTAKMSTEARQRYGAQLQDQGMRGMKRDMLEGAIECILGVYLESASSAGPDSQEMHKLSQRLIHSAIALYGDEADANEPLS